MSLKIGKSKSKSSQQSTSTTTNTLDPQLASTLYGNITDTQNAVNGLTPYTGQRVAGFNDSQKAAQQGLLDLANQHVGSGLLSQATGAAQKASTYQPMQVGATSYNPTSATASTVATPDRSSIRDVGTSAVSADQINGYMNPFLQDVADTTAADLERQRQIQATYNSAKATAAGAFGGTGAAVLQSLSDADSNRTLASTLAGIRSTGFNTALSAAQQDKARELAAAQSNQGADISYQGLLGTADQFNAGAQNTANLFNAGAANTAGQFNAGQQQAAQIANQGAGLTANGQQLAAAGLLGDLSGKERDYALGDVGLLGQVGDAQQAQQQKELDAALAAYNEGLELTARQREIINAAITMLPSYGSATTNASGTASGKNTSVNAGISWSSQNGFGG